MAQPRPHRALDIDSTKARRLSEKDLRWMLMKVDVRTLHVKLQNRGKRLRFTKLLREGRIG